jgi:hypothetical protein
VGSKAILATVAIAVLLGGGFAWYVMHQPPPSDSLQPLTPDAKAYVRNLKLTDVTMKATDSYVQQMVTEIEGKIANGGDRVVKQADVYCIFYNSYGEVVRRVRIGIVKNALKPGEARSFRLPFDDIPSSWNNQMPQLVIARVEFG